MARPVPRLVAALTAALLLAATLGLAGPAGATAPPLFDAPVRVNPDLGEGYEPSIKVDSAGTIFVTAHKNQLVEPVRANSWIWRSTDGKTFTDMPGGELFYSFEGDWAIDAKDRLYFVDTYLGDNHFASWSANGTKLDYYRPFTLTGAPVDDRPWLTAHHDGVVYLLVNLGYTPDGRLELYRSTDGGRTFDARGGRLFPESGWGTPAADPHSDYVYVAMNDKFYNGDGYPLDTGSEELFIWISPDRGETFRRVKVADYDGTDPDGYPVVSVDGAGHVYILWPDKSETTRSRLKLSRSLDRGETWETFDITPKEYRHNDLAWLAADPNATGRLGIGWYASPDKSAPPASLRPDRQQFMRWDFLAGTIDGAHLGEPALGWTVLDTHVQGDPGFYFIPPQDFAQVAFGPDHRLHVTWGTWRKRSAAAPKVTFDIWYAGQAVPAP